MLFKRIILLCALACVIAASGCAGYKSYTREQWLEGTTRVYDNVTTDQVLLATEKIFVLADESDVTFAHRQNGIKISRFTAPFPAVVYFHWDIQCEPVDNGVKVTVIDLSASGQALLSYIEPNPLSGLSVIDLYFKRLEYLLGKSQQWYSCKDYEQAFPDHTSLEALCILADDERP